MKRFCLVGLLSCLIACQQETLEDAMLGGFRVSLKEQSFVSETKSAPSELAKPLVSKFSLRIKNTQTGKLIYDDKFTDQVIAAPTGTYEVCASYGENAILALDAPYYLGQKSDLHINANDTKSVILECKVANALASINWENKEKLDKSFENYGVKVVVEDASVNIPAGDKKSAYFRAGSKVSFFFYGSLKGGEPFGDQELLGNGLPNAFVEGQHCILNLAIGDGLSVKINKVEIKKESITETIPMDWLPKPKVIATGFTNNVLEHYETETPTAKIDLQLSSGLQEFDFSLNLNDANYEALNGDYSLRTLSPDQKQKLEEAGICLPELNVKDHASMDLSNLIGNFQSSEKGTVRNEIIITKVKANDRLLEAPLTCTILTKRPDFSVSVFPVNIWTKEFSVNELSEKDVLGGDFQKIKNHLSYQYSLDQKVWKTIDDKELKQTGLTPNTTYYVRGVFRGVIGGKCVEIKTYPQISLENGGMEEWTEEERGYYFKAFGGSQSPKLRTYYPWISNCFWNTNNDYTTRYRDSDNAAFSTVYRYNSFPAVSYTPEAFKGQKAAVLRNTAAGRGNTSSSSSSYSFNNVPGELFIGNKLNVTMNGVAARPTGDSYEPVLGAPFASRPKALRFYYKYLPHNLDSWKVYIALLNRNDIIVAENTMIKGGVQQTYLGIDIPFIYNSEIEDIVPAKIIIHFFSSDKKGDELPYSDKGVKTWFKGKSRVDQTLSGSEFTIDEISLVYDGDQPL